ncbi:hypothetical protein POVWA2_001160 [Plasmodium ovale wallikeri]|uniref:Uncharacterized protein n=1 Tax=Plasmodium ovale wallikeri TaxID=864142 RepID=A0A1A8YH76_PLAOA|nr:hypothetical protein POVWA1_000890 [Plasmodium ovale wallikeri]SBT30881.1 hypothetical protein POVWA2_001160 [Plasmodium ovale wallikeri]
MYAEADFYPFSQVFTCQSETLHYYSFEDDIRPLTISQVCPIIFLPSRVLPPRGGHSNGVFFLSLFILLPFGKQMPLLQCFSPMKTVAPLLYGSSMDKYP